MADLAVTIGADTTELEKKVKEAGKTIKNGLTPGQQGVMKGANFAQNLMAGNVGSAIGSLFGPVGEAVGGMVDAMIAKAKELMDAAIQLRALSMQTNLTTQQIQGLENVSKATGISVSKLADSISEYNRRLGYAQMHGGEMNVLLNKMGVSFDQIKNRTFTYFDAIKALGEAQAAGTDEATLNHYANVMLGSSYKELLPLIKMGSENLRIYSENTYKTSKESIQALTEAGDYWNAFAESVKNMAMDMLGRLLQFMEEGPADLAESMQRAALTMTPEQVLRNESNEMGPMDEVKKRELLKQSVNLMGQNNPYGQVLSPAKQKEYMDLIDKMFPAGNPRNKLNPFGSELAQGASQMQQMGGGDLFGAVSFNPMQRVAENTDAINSNVAKIANQQTPTNDPKREGLEK